MMRRFNNFLDWFSNFFAHRKGLLPLIGISLIVANLLLAFFTHGWLIETNLLLHVGVIFAILGFMIAWAI